MKKEEIEQAITGIDERFILEALDDSSPQKRKMGTKLFILVAAIIGITGLSAFSNGMYFFQYVGYSYGKFERWVDVDGSHNVRASINVDWDSEPPYRIENGQIYFTFDGSDRNITEYCSETDFFIYDKVNMFDRGYYIAIGGTVDNVGYRVCFMDDFYNNAAVTSYSGDATKHEIYTKHFQEHLWEVALDYEKYSRSYEYKYLTSDEQRAEQDEIGKPKFEYKITKN